MRNNRRNKQNRNIEITMVLLIALVIVISLMAFIYIRDKNKDKDVESLNSEKNEVDTLNGLPEGFSTKIEEIVKEEEEKEVKNINGEYIDNGKPKIALTFDDGPWHTTDRLLDILEKYDVKATFFVLGEHAKKYPEPLKRAAEMGMEIGNHSYAHTKLTEGNFDAFMKEIEDTNDFLMETIGKKSTVIRLPGGAFGYDENFLKKIPYPILNWTIDTMDWKTRDSEDIFNHIKEKAKDGSVILIHDIYSTTIDAFEKVIPYLIEQGYDLVTLDQLAKSRGFVPENGVIYTTYTKEIIE